MKNARANFAGTHVALGGPRGRAAILVLVFLLLPYIGHFAWFSGEYLANNLNSVLAGGERLLFSMPAPDHWLLRAASLGLAGLAGFAWVLGEILNYIQRAAVSEMGE